MALDDTRNNVELVLCVRMRPAFLDGRHMSLSFVKIDGQSNVIGEQGVTGSPVQSPTREHPRRA